MLPPVDELQGSDVSERRRIAIIVTLGGVTFLLPVTFGDVTTYYSIIFH